MNRLHVLFVSSALTASAPLAAAQVETASAELTGARPVEMVKIDFVSVTRRALQLGLLSQDLGYTLSVAADGSVTDCALSRTFRNRLTTKELCRSIMRSVALAPARDAQGNAIGGTYEGQVRIRSPFAASQ
jgi:hypothetical protein